VPGYRFRIITGLGLFILPSLAEAQALPRGEAARGVTVANRAREDFDPLGVRLGGFRLNAAAELGMGYDDNLFGTRRNRTSDGYATWLGEGGVQSDWSRHALGLNARVEQRRYIDNNELDWTDYTIGGFGRYDINADTNVEARLNRVQEHLETSSIDVQQAGLTRPVPYVYNEAQAQVQTRFNRIGVLLLGNYRDYSFENVDIGPAPAPGAPRPGDVSRFDFQSALGALGLTYEIGPGRFVNLIGRYQDIRYDDTAQRDRDSRTWEVLAGFTYDFDGLWAVRAAAGYRERNYEGQGLKNLAGPAFEGEVTWQPTLLTTVTFGARRSIEESIRNNAVSFTRTQGQVRVDHEYLRSVILGAELGVDRREYDQPDEQATDGYGILSARWLLNRNLSVVASYQHSRRLDSSTNIEEFDRNLVQLRLRIAL
jgi:hypothetical protein